MCASPTLSIQDRGAVLSLSIVDWLLCLGEAARGDARRTEIESQKDAEQDNAVVEGFGS